MEPRPRGNDPVVLILTSLSSGPKHGYALLQDIDEFAGVRLGPGTLYGAIARLEKRGLIQALEPSGRTRPYALTSAGGQELTIMLDGLRAIVDAGTSRLGHTAIKRPVRLGRTGAPA